MGDLSKNFSLREFACQCGCGFNRVEPELVRQIQRYRDILWISTGMEIPVTVTSGCRCPDHNAEVGGGETSFHIRGKAADIFFARIPVLAGGRIVYLANRLGVMKIGGIGAYPDRNFIHIDIRPKRISTWINENGFYRYGVDFSEEVKQGVRI